MLVVSFPITLTEHMGKYNDYVITVCIMTLCLYVYRYMYIVMQVRKKYDSKVGGIKD
jgi:hypothetical protein